MPKNKPERKADSSDSDSGPEDVAPAKKSKPAPSKGSKGSGDSDELSWELGKNRTVKLSEFKGKWYVNIREYYLDKDGELKPGKKGIMLTMEQWQLFNTILPELNEAVKKNV